MVSGVLDLVRGLFDFLIGKSSVVYGGEVLFVCRHVYRGCLFVCLFCFVLFCFGRVVWLEGEVWCGVDGRWAVGNYGDDEDGGLGVDIG